MLPGSPTTPAERFDEPEAFLREPSSFALAAYIDDAPVGLAWGLQMRSPSGRLTTYVHQLDVHETWRRQGIGSALILRRWTSLAGGVRRSSGCRPAGTTRPRKRCTNRSAETASRSATSTTGGISIEHDRIDCPRPPDQPRLRSLGRGVARNLGSGHTLGV